MKRPLLLFLILGVLSGCSSDEEKPPIGGGFAGAGGAGGSGGIGGSGGTAGTGGEAGDAAADGATDGSAGTDSSADASGDSSTDGPDPNIPCVDDPIPTQGQGYCVTIDADGYQCDPITSAPCNIGAGETCDFDGERFRCIPQDFALVGACGLCTDPYPDTCIPGFTCLGLAGKCSRYCCDSLQCALGQECIMQPPTSLGICQATSDQVFAGFVGAPPADAGADVIDSGQPSLHPECHPPAAAGSGTCVNMSLPEFPCNPVTNEGCNSAADEACDADGSGFACVAGAHDGWICAPCTAHSCRAGLTCVPSVGCVKYCCSAADCTPGQCDPYPGLGGLGVCVALQSGDAG